MADNHFMLAAVKIHGRERKSTTYLPWTFTADNTLFIQSWVWWRHFRWNG